MLTRLDIQNFDEIYRILAESFPVDEIRPYELQKALFSKKTYKVLGLCGEEGIRAVLAVYDLESVIFVEHFAVDAKYRNQGLGAVALGELLAASDKPVCLEVELPETELARRRIGFYQRNGLHYCDSPYVQPPLSPGQNALPLRLMSSAGPMTRETFEKVRDEIHREVYNSHL